MKAVVMLSDTKESVGSFVSPQNVTIEAHRVDHRIENDDYLYVYGVDENEKRVSTFVAAAGKWSCFTIIEGASL